MKNISFRFPTSIRDIKVLWKEYTSKRYRKNIEVMRKMTDFYIRNVLEERWGEVADGKVVAWTDADKRQFQIRGINMSHIMMLSDLYGRIGQMLKEYGDAPIGKVESPIFPNEPHTTTDWIKPIYCSFHLATTEIGKIKIKTYEPVMEE